MPIENAKRDQNYKTTLQGVDMTTGLLPTNVYVDETTHRLLVSAIITSGGGGSSAGRYALHEPVRQDLDGDPIYSGKEDVAGNWVIVRTNFTTQTTMYFEGTGGLNAGTNWAGRAGYTYVEFNTF